jgi:DNA (cytosine-5)-methyltransferase 1
MTEPRNNRGASKQDYETPWELISAIEHKFGQLDWDLACTLENGKAPRGFTPEDDSLSRNWAECDGHLWLNPPFADIAPWAKKCAESGSRVTMLVPASIDSNWFRDYVYGKATVVVVSPRISFDGRNSFPKPCMLCLYGREITTTQLMLWRWK